MAKGFVHKLLACLGNDGTDAQFNKLLKRVVFSDGTVTNVWDIWTLNYMPPELDLSNIDLTEGEGVAGAQGETIREMIRATYHCKSRAEEDFFLSRWIAS